MFNKKSGMFNSVIIIIAFVLLTGNSFTYSQKYADEQNELALSIKGRDMQGEKGKITIKF